MRSGRPGPVLIDLPFDVQMAEIEFDIDTYEPLPVYKPAATRAQVEKALDDAERGRAPADRGRRRHHQRRRQRPAGASSPKLTGVPVIPTLMGWGTIPDDHPLMAGMCGLQTSHRYGNATMLASRLRARHRQPLGQPPHRLGRGLHQGPQVRARRHRADADRPRLHARLRHRLATPRPRSNCSSKWPTRMQGRGQAEGPRRLGRPNAASASSTMLRKTNFDRRADEAAARLPGDEQRLRPRHLLRQHHRPVADRRRAVPARLQPAPLDQLRPGRPAGLDHSRPRSACVAADPTRKIVALSGDYDFQFMIEELAVGAQFKLPYMHVRGQQLATSA